MTKGENCINKYSYKNSIKEDEKFIECIHCKDYYEIRDKNSSLHLLFCKNADGLKGTGLVCLGKFDYTTEIKDLCDEEIKCVSDNADLMKHIEGSKHSKLIHELSEAIRLGSMRFCPYGGYSGVKEDGGNSICCPSGNKNYCYVGGKKDEDGDKSDPKGNIYKHFDNWKTNSKRCPPCLVNIKEIDDRWVGDEAKGVEFMHTLLVYSNIRDFINKHGSEQIGEISKKFAYFKSTRFSFEKAMTVDLTLIKRP